VSNGKIVRYKNLGVGKLRGILPEASEILPAQRIFCGEARQQMLGRFGNFRIYPFVHCRSS
jgi:hypothetical protein